MMCVCVHIYIYLYTLHIQCVFQNAVKILCYAGTTQTTVPKKLEKERESTSSWISTFKCAQTSSPKKSHQTSGSNSCIGAKSGAMSSTFSLPHDHLHKPRKTQSCLQLCHNEHEKRCCKASDRQEYTEVIRSTGQTCNSRLREPHE